MGGFMKFKIICGLLVLCFLNEVKAKRFYSICRPTNIITHIYSNGKIYFEKSLTLERMSEFAFKIMIESGNFFIC
jgi:hypothetical protein